MKEKEAAESINMDVPEDRLAHARRTCEWFAGEALWDIWGFPLRRTPPLWAHIESGLATFSRGSTKFINVNGNYVEVPPNIAVVVDGAVLLQPDVLWNPDWGDEPVYSRIVKKTDKCWHVTEAREFH